MNFIRVHYFVLIFLNLFLNSSFVLCNNTPNSSANPKKFLIFGAKGWIGGKIIALLKEQKHIVFEAQSRLENRNDLVREIEALMPDFVISAAGITGRPNIDWCEDHHQETLRANVLGAINLADVCFMHGIHMTNFGTGCIFEYDAQHPMNSGLGFTEDDEPNFTGSFYSRTKIILEKLLKLYPNVLNLRLRMPISEDLNERSFVTKITKYKRVVNIPNSMTILSDLLPHVIEMSLRKLTGIYNFVNPGTVSHNDVLELYKKYIDPSFSYENFSIEEHDKILKARRSNNELDASKLLKAFPTIPNIKDSIVQVFEKMKLNIHNKKMDR